MSVIILSPNTPHKSAAEFRNTKRPNLISLESDWLDYNEKTHAYEIITEGTITAEVSCFLIEARRATVEDTANGFGEAKTAPFNPKRANVTEVVDALHNACHRPIADFKPPCWLDGRKGDASRIIVCKNGLLDIVSGKLWKHTPQFFTRCALPIVYDELAQRPVRFLKFLKEAMDDRQPLIDLIQEMFGYLLSGDLEQEVVFYLLGKSRGGKGTLQKIILALMGQTNVAAPTIRSFSARCWAFALMSKSVAIITDMAVTDKEATRLAANHINMISGRDPIDIERLYLPALTAIMLPTRIVMAGNSLPDFGDHAAALANRLLVIPFDISFKGKEDRSLARVMIATELPGILSWALEGLRRLQARGHFVEPPESLAVKADLLRLANPVRVFIEEKCNVKPDLTVPKDALYTSYSQWCKQVGAHALPLKTFAQRLFEIVPVARSNVRFRPRVEGEQVAHYVGLDLRDRAGVAEFDFKTEMESSISLGMTEAEAYAYAIAEADRRTAGDFTVH